ncbi:MAG TPA: hypothetical protein VFC61_07775 [Blastocatellia bacterium]|nr:hypothetical protein [Blastocatellia bacterium]
MFSRLACLLAAGLLASACATTRAAAPVERPPLEVPPVPPRIIEPAPPPETVVEPVGDLPPEKPAVAATRPRPTAPPKDTQKPADPKPAETMPPPVEPPPAPPPATAAPVIRTPATADPAAAERQIRESLGSTQKKLNGINFQRLSPERQKAYNEAKDFMVQAERAIKASNFELAKGLASTAEKLASELQNR